MSDIVGIRFGDSGKTYCFRTDGLDVKKGDRVVVESDLGISIGKVYRTNCTLPAPDMELKPLLRKVTRADEEQEDENEDVRREALEYCKERIKARGLPMKLLANEVTLDRKRFIFYFVAETRVDFRELVKDLASKYRTRIELRQIGVRDAAKITGGYGICGKEFCCKSFLQSFAPISIKMAKQQELVLNTCKLSGACGRLMCCLSYEYLDPEELRKVQEQEAREAEEARRVKEALEAEEARRAEEERRAREAIEASRVADREKAAVSPGAERPSRRRRRRGKTARKAPASPPAGKAQHAEAPAGQDKDKAAPVKPRRRRRRGPRKRSKTP